METIKLTAPRARGRPCKYPVIKQRLRNAILRGELKPGQQLPAFDQVAQQLGVASRTAKRAVDALVKEGWLMSRQGVGTFVRAGKTASQIVLTAPRERTGDVFLSHELLDAFQQSHPNVRVVLSSEPVTDFVVENSYGLVVDRIRHRRLLSLDELQDRLGTRPWKLSAPMKRLASWQGTLFALPMRASLSFLQLNPRLLESCGIRPPDRFLDWETFEIILKKCRRDVDGDGEAECFGMFSDLGFQEWLVPFWQNGGRLDDETAFFAPEAFSVFDKIWRMHHVERTLPMEMPIDSHLMYLKRIRRRFELEQIALRWTHNQYITHPFPFATSIVLPRFGPVSRQCVHASLLGIDRECAHPDVAMEFLNFCHQSFIQNNAEYPLALGEEDRQLLRQMPALHRLLAEGLESASEPLHEGHPERTWAIESVLNDWFCLFIDRKTMVARLQEHWRRWSEAGVTRAETGPLLITPTVQMVSPPLRRGEDS